MNSQRRNMARALVLTSSVTDIGKIRKVNEDALLVLPNVGLLAVADGMGGAIGGAMASAEVISHLEQSARSFDESTPLSIRISTLRESVTHASTTILQWAEARQVQGTGTTIVLMALEPGDTGVGSILHAGDSRAYLLRAGRLTQLTQDHSMAAAYAEREEDVPAALRNVVTNAVGMHAHAELEETRIELCPGDIVLLCSDGLYRMVTDEQIRKILDGSGTLCERTEALRDAALQSGGKDNITAVTLEAFAVPQDARDTASTDTRDTRSSRTSAIPPSRPQPTDLRFAQAQSARIIL